MALGIYSAPSISAKFSEDKTFINPLAVTFDGRSGGTRQLRLYIRNDDPSHYYTAISLGLQDLGVTTIIDRPEDGFAWKLSEGDIQPTLNDWANVAAANTVSFTDIGSASIPDSSTFLPFWIYIQVPPGLSVQTFDRVQFILRGEENLIP